jgi:flagellar P-ring protein precursor FlgI
VVDQRSGTIVLGADVRISPVAVAQGGLTVSVREEPLVVQPDPFSTGGETIVVPRTDIAVGEGGQPGFAYVESGVSLAQLIEGLNALGVAPSDMIDILKTIKSAGALHAEFLVQ